MKRINISSIYFFIYSSLVFLSSCDKPDNYGNLEINYQYQAKFSLPIIDSLGITITQNALNIPTYYDSIPDSIKKLIHLPVLKFQSSFPFDFSALIDTTKTKPINKLIFRFAVTNDFPLKGQFSLYLRDVNQTIQDSFNTKLPFPSAIIGDSITIPKDTIEEIAVDTARVKKWTNVKDIMLSGYINNDSLITSKFYRKYYKFKINISAGVEIDFNYNLKAGNGK